MSIMAAFPLARSRNRARAVIDLLGTCVPSASSVMLGNAVMP